jgi:hypothetical protein
MREGGREGGLLSRYEIGETDYMFIYTNFFSNHSFFASLHLLLVTSG